MPTKKLGNWKQPLNPWKDPSGFLKSSVSAIEAGLRRLIRFNSLNKYFAKYRIGMIWVPSTLVALFALWLLVFTFDNYIFSQNDVPRNTQLEYKVAGRVININVGGLSEDAVSQRLGEIDLTQPVQLVLPEGLEKVNTSATELGITPDVEATTQAVKQIRRKKGFFGGLISWSSSFFSPDKVEIEYHIDPSAVKVPSLSLPILIRQAKSASFQQIDPTQPLTLMPQVLGAEIDATSIYSSAQSLVKLNFPSSIDVVPNSIFPKVQNSQMSAAIRVANTRTAAGLDILLQDTVRRMSTEIYRSTFEYGTDSQTEMLTAQIASNTLLQNVEILFTDFVTDRAKPVFEISLTGVPELRVEGSNVGCCAPIGASQIKELIEGKTLLLVATKELSIQALSDFNNLNIVEKIASFTQSFDVAQEAHANNIGVATEAIRGTVILPGDSWSLNSHLGERTAQKGYVLAQFPFPTGFQAVAGGGIEVVATALFNAALLAGMDVPVRQSHAVDNRNYPFGRDALVGWPSPGLIISNPTPNGILIWTQIGGGKVTVDIYSSKFYDRIAIGETFNTPVGNCSRARVNRVRRDMDGNRLEDAFFSFYIPDFGVGCGGTTTEQEEQGEADLEEGGELESNEES